MRQAFKHPRHLSHLWMILLALPALAAVYAFETFAAGRPSAAAATLDVIFSLPGGYYDQDVQLEIGEPDAAAYVLFTTDGSAPTHANGAIYIQPIRLSAAAPAVTVIRARAVLPDGELGPVVSASYFVGLRTTLPLLSLIVEPDDLWDNEHGIYANPLGKGDEWERPVDITYAGENRKLGFHIPAGVRIHGGESRLRPKKGLRLYFRQEYGASQLEYPLFANGEVETFKRLVLHNGGQDWHTHGSWNWTLMRNQLMDRLALELGGYAARSQPALLFVNGEPWGIYYVRERIDRYFLAAHYDVASADLLNSPEHAWDANVAMGDREHWDHLMRFLETHNLTNPADYAYVQTQVDIANFIDYNLLQIYAADVDWPHHNVQQLRPRVQGGRWQWMFWDSDHCFGALPHGRVDSNILERTLDRDHPETDGRDALLLRRLLENPDFVRRFLSRAADLLNTTLAPPAVIAHVDDLAAALGPDIGYESVHWGGSTNWEASVEELRDFARRRPDLVRRQIVERFGLDGTAQLAFETPDSGSGYVAVNGGPARELPWQGVYFHTVPIQITAAPAPGYRFAGWLPPNLPQTPVITLTVTAAQTIAPRFEPLDKDAPRPGDVIFTDYRMGEWFELRVARPGGVDLRGWRITDNDAKTATDEGSLIFADDSALARVPRGTTIRIIVGEGNFKDDLSVCDRRMTLHVDSPVLDARTDPGFNLGPSDNLVLLAPGPTPAFSDDLGIAFVANGAAVTPTSFGALADGVLPTQ
ncbi:MAG: hypothetical protein DRJ03_22175 [Chloroflexi bacterium]|nr:MAG: hypothetical protein DRI81_09635 [Chloroflexota bacterium]RLC80177.1 MAG: hypothetical protein DRJ03_22175 [Chloroflexota bacterium]